MERRVEYSTYFNQLLLHTKFINSTFLDLRSYNHSPLSIALFYHKSKSNTMVRQAEKSLRDQHKPSLVGVISFKDNTQYAINHEFTVVELTRLTPENIVRWMRLKSYGTLDLTFDQNPTQGRSSSLAYTKKSISHFIPNRLMAWNEMSVPPAENPTRSTVVNDLSNLVKMKEVRKQGKPSQAWKQFEQP